MADATSLSATLLISSKNYSSWSLRGFLLCRLSGLSFHEQAVATDDAIARAELLMRTSSIRVPCLIHDSVSVWDTLAIAEYLNEVRPEAQMLPAERAARARCRSISGEMHSGFSAVRSSLPMNLRSHAARTIRSGRPHRPISTPSPRSGATASKRGGGPWLFGERPTIADAMYAPVVTRLITYDVKIDATCQAYCDQIMQWPDMQEWVAAAKQEPEMIDELEADMEF